MNETDLASSALHLGLKMRVYAITYGCAWLAAIRDATGERVR